MRLLDVPLQRDAQALYRIFTAVGDGLDRAGVSRALVEQTVAELGYRAATLHLLDVAQATLALRADSGIHTTSERMNQGDCQRLTARVPGKALMQASERSKLLTLPADEWPEGEQEGGGKTVVVPLELGHRVVGVLRVYAAPHHTFSEQERTLLEAVAAFGAAAIERAHHAAALQQFAAGLMGCLDLKAVLRAFLAPTVQALEASAGSLWLLDPTRQMLSLAAAHGLSRAYVDEGAVRLAEDRMSTYVLRRSDPIALTELCEGDELPYPEEAQREGMRGMLVAPLRLCGEGFGVLRIYTSELRRFNSQELAFVGRVVELGALAIDNARRHEEPKAGLATDSSTWWRLLKRR